jgi:hypothetical protein
VKCVELRCLRATDGEDTREEMRGDGKEKKQTQQTKQSATAVSRRCMGPATNSLRGP